MQIYFLIVNINVSMKNFHLNIFAQYVTKNFVFIASLGQSQISEILVYKIEMLPVFQKKDNIEIIGF